MKKLCVPNTDEYKKYMSSHGRDTFAYSTLVWNVKAEGHCTWCLAMSLDSGPKNAHSFDRTHEGKAPRWDRNAASIV